MIVKQGNRYQVKSATGSKNLSKANLTKSQAVKRLRAVEYWKTQRPAK